MKYTIDASVLVKTVVDEDYSENALRVVSDQRTILYAPGILFSEVGGVLYKMTRRGIMQKSYALRAYENLLKLPVEIQEDEKNILPDILEMSLRHSLHFYDCLYIQTARKAGSTLLSSDQKLLDVAAKECSVRHLQDI
jgi:predicted nucleic acid-binding protein